MLKVLELGVGNVELVLPFGIPNNHRVHNLRLLSPGLVLVPHCLDPLWEAAQVLLELDHLQAITMLFFFIFSNNKSIVSISIFRCSLDVRSRLLHDTCCWALQHSILLDRDDVEPVLHLVRKLGLRAGLGGLCLRSHAERKMTAKVGLRLPKVAATNI